MRKSRGALLTFWLCLPTCFNVFYLKTYERVKRTIVARVNKSDQKTEYSRSLLEREKEKERERKEHKRSSTYGQWD